MRGGAENSFSLSTRRKLIRELTVTFCWLSENFRDEKALSSMCLGRIHQLEMFLCLEYQELATS